LNEPCHRTDQGRIALDPSIINMTVTRNMTISPCLAPVTPSQATINAHAIHVIDRQCSRKIMKKVSVKSAHPTAKENKVSARSRAATESVTNFWLARVISAEATIKPAAHRTVRSGQVSLARGVVVVGFVIGWMGPETTDAVCSGPIRTSRHPRKFARPTIK
jgi:hypothetical protein